MSVTRHLPVLLVLVTLFGLLAMTPVAAQGTVDCGDDAATTVATTYNQNLDQAPDFVKGLFAGKTTELRIGSGSTMPTATTGDAYHFTLTDDGRLTDCAPGDAESPDVRVRMSNETLTEIATADSPGTAFEDAYDDGDVQVNGVGVTNTIVVGAAKFANWLTGLF